MPDLCPGLESASAVLMSGAEVGHMTQQMEKGRARTERNQAIEKAVVELLNVAVSLTGACGMCHQESDEHTSTCPVPALEEWINPTLDD